MALHLGGTSQTLAATGGFQLMGAVCGGVKLERLWICISYSSEAKAFYLLQQENPERNA